jgi:hypothetical protein
MQFFFEKNKKSSGELSEKIATLCEGLVYISETDAPFTPFRGGRVSEVNGETIVSQAELAADAPVEEIGSSAFFARLTRIERWHTQAQRAMQKKFLELQTLLEENLRDLKVFKVGRIRVDIYAVGLDADGDLLGVKTQAVET